MTDPMSLSDADNAVRFHDFSPRTESFRNAVKDGLRASPKQISPKFFYDQRGSVLFDQICELPEYYPTRTELAILRDNADAIGAAIGTGGALIELGSGASKKVRLLLDVLKPAQYCAVDISRDFLIESCEALAADFPWLEVHAVYADYSERLELPLDWLHGQRTAFFPGSSIGNFEPEQAKGLLTQVADNVGPDGLLLIGVDLKKSHDTLHAAYNDAAGVTADFNLNLLDRMGRELDADIDRARFAHHAFYNTELGRVEMHLKSLDEHAIRIDGEDFPIGAGETIHTECSYKYSSEEFARLAAECGFKREAIWTDADQLFSVQLFRAMA